MVRHQVMINGSPVVDEICTCGHLKSMHAEADHGALLVSGHGPCKLCECRKFTWARFITQDEAINNMRSA